MLFLNHPADLTSSEEEVYTYICENISGVLEMSQNDLANATFRSTASINRFCKKFECTGFRDFKIKLGLYYQSLVHTFRPNEELEMIHFLTKMKDGFFLERINQAIEYLNNADLIIFIGCGSSKTIAEYGSLFFTNLSHPALFIEDPSNYPINWFSDRILEKTCFVFLSISGETVPITSYLKRLKGKNCPTIAITNNDSTPIGRLAKLTIPYYIKRETIYKYADNMDKTIELTSQLPALYIIEYLAKGLARKIH
jgi:DNA-binding MurR/RpiR family transcriptional regulator